MRVQEAFSRHQSVMVQMPTGTGKTYLLAVVVRRFVEKGDVWIVAHRKELVSQIEETLARFELVSFASGAFHTHSSLSHPYSSFIRVMSIQWLTLHYREMEKKPSLIVIDEAHHAVAKTYAEVMRAFPKAKKLGLTATPYLLKGCSTRFLMLYIWAAEAGCICRRKPF